VMVLALATVALGSASPVGSRIARASPSSSSFVMDFFERLATGGGTGITNRPGMGRPTTNIVESGMTGGEGATAGITNRPGMGRPTTNIAESDMTGGEGATAGITNRPGMGRPTTNIAEGGMDTADALLVDQNNEAGPALDLAKLPNKVVASAALGQGVIFTCTEGVGFVEMAKNLACVACTKDGATESGCVAAAQGLQQAIAACTEVCSPKSQCITAANLYQC